MRIPKTHEGTCLFFFVSRQNFLNDNWKSRNTFTEGVVVDSCMYEWLGESDLLAKNWADSDVPDESTKVA